MEVRWGPYGSRRGLPWDWEGAHLGVGCGSLGNVKRAPWGGHGALLEVGGGPVAGAMGAGWDLVGGRFRRW